MADIFRATWVVSYRELLRFIQERTRLFSSFAMPLLFLVIFGAGFNRIIAPMIRLKPAPKITRNSNGIAKEEKRRVRSWIKRSSSRYDTTHVARNMSAIDYLPTPLL